MEWEEIVILITVILGIFAFIGILYDAWSSLKNARNKLWTKATN